WLIALFIALYSILPGVAYAQSSPTIDTLEIDLWPEYDRPDVLVIYRMALSSSTSLPVEMTLRLPRQAGAPYNLAYQDVDGLLYNLDYTTQVEGDWQAISFTTPSLSLQIEYYDPGMERQEGQRSFEYRWPGDYTAHSVNVQVQKPLTAANLQIVPDMGDGEAGPNGLEFHQKSIGEVEAGTSFTIRFSYDKSDDSLAPGVVAVQPDQPITPDTAGRTTFSEVLPWILGMVGVLLIGGGAFWYWQASRDLPEERKRLRHLPAATRPSPGGEEGGEVYCAQCGRRAERGDVYCRACGAKLRYE
ncbi:MAG: zinc ribbon domain-containing protein, partial [Anaerolineaceae bacterium]|nr:zinc ribbon domain-containing protein [Anaerolineaceae bacterium]